MYNIEDRKEFINIINEYIEDYDKFCGWLKSLNMFEKYHGLFENNAICSFWSFEHYIKNSSDIVKIIKHKQHANIIWNAFQENEGN